ncbi:hypothetical protein Nepgr_013636 [Nepenthes gracilis]|uniref:Tf2-1-like SH3-like domain-containing protein n=1 Tax=Nepenthes gracilis TaxID=150966 RepID=A0AAD3SHU7_NEPGR|nr:hypothetical protein Nepgr_013636 [Nepenthes gracilis]
MIQILDDMLWASVLEFKGNWDDHLAVAEFAYNSSFQASISMAPFEALYGVSRFGVKEKLKPQYIGPFEILERIGEVAYRLALPPNSVKAHNVSHVSMWRKYVYDLTHIIDYGPLAIQEDLHFSEELVEILDEKDQILRLKTIPLVKVLWMNHTREEVTWEREEEICVKYPHLF